LLDTPGALDGGGSALLSPAEAAHARDYFLVAGRHLKQAAARRLPPQFDSLVRQSAASLGRDMVSGPNLDVHVVVRALADKGEEEFFFFLTPSARERRREKTRKRRSTFLFFFFQKSRKLFTFPGTVEVDPDGSSTVELREGDTYAMRYAAARELLADEWVALV
jgi:hypothetical protein